MKFPYGNADFYDVITSDYFYVDRTRYIPVIEDYGKVLLFLRPRRFGKSLLLSMLENYYDIAKVDEFERLFGHLEIGQQPTPKHNQYFIMQWNFAMVATQDTAPEMRQAIYDYINGRIEEFKARYRDYLDHEIVLDANNALRSLQSLLVAVRISERKLYLLIDEYDNIANEVLMAGLSDSQQRYETLVKGEGVLRTIFKAVKDGIGGRGIDRVFITGVSPVVMSDITSGFNIAEDIYLLSVFNDLCGFWEHEIAEAVQQIVVDCDAPPEKAVEALDIMRKLYDGYSFAYNELGTLYNPTMVLYFLKAFQRDCEYPQRTLDMNLAMDRGKIAYVAHLSQGNDVVSQALNEAYPLTVFELADRFGVQEILKSHHDATFMISLLYYFGVLTLMGKRTAQGELQLRIPNLVIRRLYVERLQERLLPDFEAREAARYVAGRLYQFGELAPLCAFIEQKHFAIFDNRDYRWANELTIKTVFLTLLFNDTVYIMDSEPALQRDYADLVMIVRPDMRQYELLDILIEFKYVALGKNNLTGEQVRALSEEDVRTLPAVEDAFTAARLKLKDYRKLLCELYGGKLRLRTYTVVAVGFDCLVWEEIVG